jgi:hypothetical protein
VRFDPFQQVINLTAAAGGSQEGNVGAYDATNMSGALFLNRWNPTSRVGGQACSLFQPCTKTLRRNGYATRHKLNSRVVSRKDVSNVLISMGYRQNSAIRGW